MLADLMIYNTNQPILEYKFDTFFSLFMLKYERMAKNRKNVEFVCFKTTTKSHYVIKFI